MEKPTRVFRAGRKGRSPFKSTSTREVHVIKEHRLIRRVFSKDSLFRSASLLLHTKIGYNFGKVPKKHEKAQKIRRDSSPQAEKHFPKIYCSLGKMHEKYTKVNTRFS